jgi:hypothetical protein
MGEERGPTQNSKAARFNESRFWHNSVEDSAALRISSMRLPVLRRPPSLASTTVSSI